MDTPVFTVLYQPQDRFTGEPARPTDQLHIFPKRIDRTAGTGKSTGAVVAGGIVKCVGFFQIEIVRKRLLYIFQISKTNAGKTLQDTFDRRCRIAVDGQRTIRHAVDPEAPFGVQLCKFLL